MSEPKDPKKESPEEQRLRLMQSARQEENETDAILKLLKEMNAGKEKPSSTPGGNSPLIH
jgi:hypothetical protein